MVLLGSKICWNTRCITVRMPCADEHIRDMGGRKQGQRVYQEESLLYLQHAHLSRQCSLFVALHARNITAMSKNLKYDIFYLIRSQGHFLFYCFCEVFSILYYFWCTYHTYNPICL